MKKRRPRVVEPVPERQPPSRPADRPRRLVVLVLVAAVLALVGEVAWYSDPVQDWWTARQSLDRLGHLVQEQHGSTRVRYYYAMALLRHRRSGEALEHAQAGTIMDPSSARLHRAAGVAAQAEGRLADAWKMLSRARELGDHSAPLLEAIASLEMTRERMGAAAQILEESVRRHPQRAESWYLLGQCRGALGMPKAWLEAMHRATQSAPRAPRYWLGLVEAWLFNDRPDEALRAADRALSLDADHFDGWLARARSLGMLAKNAAELAEADSAFQRAIHSTRAEAWEAAAARREYGKFLLAHGLASEAVEPLERSVRAVPEDQSAAYALAQAYRRVGAERKAETAMRRFEQVSGQLRDLRYLQSRVAADPFNPDVRLALARALEAAGRLEEARVHYQRSAGLRRGTYGGLSPTTEE